MIPAISFSLHEAISNNHSLGDIQKFIHPVACNIKNQQGESALKLACGNREENVIECVIHGGADITEEMGPYRYTVLHVAAGAGYLKLVRLLLKHGVVVNARSSDGSTPLFDACRNGHVEVAQILLSAGAEVYLKADDDRMALHVAAAAGQAGIVQLLLTQQQEHLNARTKSRYTPLYLACQHENPRSAALLIKAGADVKATNGPEDQTALYMAVRMGHTSLIRLLLERGAELNGEDLQRCSPLYHACEAGNLEAARALIEAGAKIHGMSRYGTALHIAIRKGRHDLMRLLLEEDPQSNIKTPDRLSPLYLTCQRGDIGAAQLLFEYGADAKADNGHYQTTSLHLSASRADTAFVKLLLEKGADPHAKTRSFLSPLHIACEKGNLEVATLLIDAGADVNAQSKDGTPLHAAVKIDYLPLVRLLLDRGANPKATTRNRISPFYLACFQGKFEMAKALLEKGADVHEMDGSDAETALHIAVTKGHMGLIRLLLNGGASPNVKTPSGYSSLYLACQRGDVDVAEELLEHGADVNAENGCLKETALYAAVPCENLGLLLLLLDKGAKSEVWNDRSPLYLACEKGYLKAATILIEKGAYPKKGNERYGTPLSVAKKYEQKEIVDLIENKKLF